MRYSYIEKVCSQCVVKKQETKEQIRSERIDRIFTHRVLAIPIFLLIMFTIFWLTFSVLGAPLQELLDQGIGWVTDHLDQWMSQAGVADILHSLIINGVCAGVGSVLSFLPIIVILFLFLSCLLYTSWQSG